MMVPDHLIYIFQTPCCYTAYDCRFCHDDAVTNHILDRQKVMEIECLLCFTRQSQMNASSRIVKQLQSELEIAVNARNGDDEKETQETSCAVTCEECPKKVIKHL